MVHILLLSPVTSLASSVLQRTRHNGNLDIILFRSCLTALTVPFPCLPSCLPVPFPCPFLSLHLLALPPFRP